MGPFQNTVFEERIASAKTFAVSGPMSSPMPSAPKGVSSSASAAATTGASAARSQIGPGWLPSANGAFIAAVLVGELVMMACIPIAGAWSDRIGRKPLWRGSLLGFAALALPMYWLMGQGFAAALVGFTVLCVLFAGPLATVAATFPAMFPTQVRYAGFAIANNAAVAVFGGTAPMLADSVIEHTGWQLFPAAYVVAAAMLGLVALRFLPETAGYSLRGTGIPGVPGALERELAALTSLSAERA